MLKYQILWESVLWEPGCSMRTADGRTVMTKLISAFRNFAKASSKNYQSNKYKIDETLEWIIDIHTNIPPLQVSLLAMRWRSWLRYCATNRKVAGSIPDGVTGIFQWLNPSGRIMALGSTFMCRLSRNSGASASWNPKGLSRPVAGKLYLLRVAMRKRNIAMCQHFWQSSSLSLSLSLSFHTHTHTS